MEKATMTVKELQSYLNIGRVTAYELCNMEGFPSFRIGRKVLIYREGLERWLKERGENKDED